MIPIILLLVAVIEGLVLGLILRSDEYIMVWDYGSLTYKMIFPATKKPHVYRIDLSEYVF